VAVANFKRQRPKMARAGCLHCKPWKGNGSTVADRTPAADRRRLDSADEQLREARGDVKPGTAKSTGDEIPRPAEDLDDDQEDK
jgi:hypothetical protein